MKTNTNLLSVILLITLLCGCAQKKHTEEHTSAQATFKNGEDWIYFGPAIINSAKTFEYIDQDHHYVITQYDKGFPAMKKWVRDRISQRLNLSPAKTQEPPASEYPTMVLYDEVPDFKRLDKSDKQFLLRIPMTASVFGETEANAEAHRAWLKLNMPEYKNSQN